MIHGQETIHHLQRNSTRDYLWNVGGKTVPLDQQILLVWYCSINFVDWLRVTYQRSWSDCIYSIRFQDTTQIFFFKWAVRILKVTSVQMFCPGSVNISQIYNGNISALFFLLSLFESFNSHVWGFVVWEREQEAQQSSLGSVAYL